MTAAMTKRNDAAITSSDGLNGNTGMVNYHEDNHDVQNNNDDNDNDDDDDPLLAMVYVRATVR